MPAVPSKPPETILILEVTDLSRGGAGVSKDAGGRVVFIPFSAPGDQVRVRVIKEDKRYAEAELLEVLRPSALRVVPRCPAFTRCGGCKWQHLPYELQWKTKAAGVRHALSRVQVALPEVFDELPAERVWEYRNRVQLRGFRDEIGFYAAGSNDLVPVDRCDIARPEINGHWAQVRQEGSLLSRPYKVELEVLQDGEFRHLWNAPHGAGGFRQVHDEQNLKLQDWVAKALSPGLRLFDLFGGSGNLSLPLAVPGNSREIHCVDVGAPSDRSASPSRNPPAAFHFHRSETVAWIQRASGSFRSMPSSAILDPPRIGLHKDLGLIEEGLRRLGVLEIALIGCDPDSWARDLAGLQRRGWKLSRVGALDLFPQTPHVESLALLVPG